MARAYNKKCPVTCMCRWSVEHASEQQLSVTRDHVTMEKPFLLMMPTFAQQSQRMSGSIRRMHDDHQQAKQAEQHNSIQALPCNGTAVVQCLTGLRVFEGLYKGVDQGQTARCPGPVYDLPTSLRKAMQNLCTMNS